MNIDPNSSCKGLRINVRSKDSARENISKFKYIPKNKVGFTSEDLESCFKMAEDKLRAENVASVFFTLKGTCGETVFGNARGGKVRERTEIAIEDLTNGKGLEMVRQNFIERNKTTPGFYS